MAWTVLGNIAFFVILAFGVIYFTKYVLKTRL